MAGRWSFSVRYCGGLLEELEEEKNREQVWGEYCTGRAIVWNTNLLHREDWFVGESSRMFLKEGWGR